MDPAHVKDRSPSLSSKMLSPRNSDLREVKHNIKVFCRFRPPNAVEVGKEIESTFIENFNMDRSDYRKLQESLSAFLAVTGPVTVKNPDCSITKPLNDFQTEDILLWLKSLGLNKYCRRFRSKKVDGLWLRNPPPCVRKQVLEIKDNWVVNTRKGRSQVFKLDGVLSQECNQEKLYKMVGAGVVESVMEGYNATVFAYGQTGTGKTHSMLCPNGGIDRLTDKSSGLIPRCISMIFERLWSSDRIVEFEFSLAIMEIYKEAVKDLLAPGVKLQLRYVGKDSNVTNLSWWTLESTEDALNHIQIAMSRRQTDAHSENDVSSRSHVIFILKLTSTLENRDVEISTLTFGDFAGSERAAKTKIKGKDRKATKDILKSLFSLQSVIRALSEKRAFIPYHGGLLTKLLRDSLGGNSKTSIILTASPHELNRSETVATLKFGEIAKKVLNEPKCNRILSRRELESKLSSMRDELQYLRRLKANNFKTNLQYPRRRSRQERKSISKMITDSSILLVPLANRPSAQSDWVRRLSKEAADLCMVANENIDCRERESDLRRNAIYEDEDEDESDQGNTEEIVMLQDQLTGISVRFKELQIDCMKKDNRVICLEQSLQEKVIECSRLTNENAELSGCPGELVIQREKREELLRKTQDLKREIRTIKEKRRRKRKRGRKAYKPRPICSSFFC